MAETAEAKKTTRKKRTSSTTKKSTGTRKTTTKKSTGAKRTYNRKPKVETEVVVTPEVEETLELMDETPVPEEPIEDVIDEEMPTQEIEAIKEADEERARERALEEVDLDELEILDEEETEEEVEETPEEEEEIEEEIEEKSLKEEIVENLKEPVIVDFDEEDKIVNLNNKRTEEKSAVRDEVIPLAKESKKADKHERKDKLVDVGILVVICGLFVLILTTYLSFSIDLDYKLTNTGVVVALIIEFIGIILVIANSFNKK